MINILRTIIFLCAICPIFMYGQNIPKTYVAIKSEEAFVIDGKPNENSWKEAKWSEMFIDIEGVEKPKYDTRVKMTWDNQNLYFFAELKEPHVWGNLIRRDTIIFYNNDFEIFIDPDGDTHNYYEFEINALNTIWDLFLSKPYRNQGKILGEWDFKGLKSAIHVNGSLNDSSDTDIGWSIEIAVPWSFTAHPGEKTKIPVNQYWRINFSRVNWDFDLTNGRYSRKKNKNGSFSSEYNWVWSQQGVVNMHEPEKWGYVYFSCQDSTSIAPFEIPKDEHVKWYLYDLYRKYSKIKDDKIIEQEKEILGQKIFPKLSRHEFGWTVWATSPFSQKKLGVNQDGKYEIK